MCCFSNKKIQNVLLVSVFNFSFQKGEGFQMNSLIDLLQAQHNMRDLLMSYLMEDRLSNLTNLRATCKDIHTLVTPRLRTEVIRIWSERNNGIAESIVVWKSTGDRLDTERELLPLDPSTLFAAVPKLQWQMMTPCYYAEGETRHQSIQNPYVLKRLRFDE
jgi:hypothetical protein